MKKNGRLLDLEFMKDNKKIFVIAGVIVVALVLILVFRMILGSESKETEKGYAYLKSLEKKDTVTIEKKVKKVKRDAQAEAVEKGEISVWEQFNGSVLFGDSRTVGFQYYEFLDKKQVLAKNGLTIKDIDTYLPQIKTLNPSVLFLCTGLNDVSTGLWKSPEDYVKSYEEKIQLLKKELPDTEIYINSIIPVQKPASGHAYNKKIPGYNKAVKAWCKEKGYAYIENKEVYEEHKDLYDVDGIHFQKKFYEYWALNMLEEVNE